MRVNNFIFKGEECVTPTDWLQANGDSRGRFSGQFAFEGVDGEGATVLARDRLGVNKLFFAINDGKVLWSNFLVDLIRDGIEIGNIWSVPSGHYVRIGPRPDDYGLYKHAGLTFQQDNNATDIAGHARTVREALEATFKRLALALADRDIVVTMSGGLDSTTIAALAKEMLSNVSGVTFSLTDGDTDSEDATFACQVAEDLGIPIRVVRMTTEHMMELLDDVLIFGQDFRDFNVHCGLVNAALADALVTGEADSDDQPVILTGDTMNELMADYSEVNLDGRTYYELPNINRGLLRRFLVSGLDSGDREVGIFAQRGLDCIQPYALCAEVYAALPADLVAADEAKQDFVQHVMGDRIPDYIYKRPKVRAQAGDSAAGQGVLGAFRRADIGQDELTSRFASLMQISMDDANRLINAGFYRFSERNPGM